MDALGGTCEVCNREDGHQGSVFTFSFPYRPDPQINSPQFINSHDSFLRKSMSNSDSNYISIDEVHDIGNMSLRGFLVESQEDSKQLLSSPNSVPSLRILVVDDSPSIRKVTKRFLTSHGHIVDIAENGSEALEKLKKVREGGTGNVSIYDMMLTDIQMPVLDGMECVKRYRQWESEGNMAKSEESSGRSTRLLIVGMSANNDEEVVRQGLSIGMDGFIGKVSSFS